MFVAVSSATVEGSGGRPVAVEVHTSAGLPSFTVVGLPDAAIRESRDRVRAALLSTGLKWPRQRVTVNLAPSGVRKGGAGLDLPIAIGVLLATDQLAHDTRDTAFVGELGLDGSLRHVPGVIALCDAVRPKCLIVPACDLAEAHAARPGDVRGATTLRRLVGALTGRGDWAAVGNAAAPEGRGERVPPVPDLADVRGQDLGRRAVEVAAAGGHHLLLIGPPGSGKTMLAERLPGLLPPLTRHQALEVSRVHSAAGLSMPPGGLLADPPFRAPHHGASSVAMVGGGSASMRPGEISLASHGVLFLDEMAEFPASVLDALRQPLEEGVVRVSRARGTVVYPARFLLVAAMNPCACGLGGPRGACRCSPTAKARYARRISGPLLDRFDLVVPLGRPDPSQLMANRAAEPTAAVAQRVVRARRMARARGVAANASIPVSALEQAAALSDHARRVLERHLRDGTLSARAAHRVWRVARTVADLAAQADGDGTGESGIGPPGRRTDEVDAAHVTEALALRSAERVLDVGPVD